MPAFSDPSQREPADQALMHPHAERGAALRAPLRLGVMASGNGTNFEALVESIAAGELCAEIPLLVVNNPGCGAQQRAQRLGVPCSVLDHRVLRDRSELERELVRRFREAEVEGIVMAGWMRIVTPVLIQAFAGRLLNVHPSLLPSFRGLDAVGQALASGVTISGCTVHLVTEELDAGPILAQAAVPVLETDDHVSLSARIRRQEHRVLPQAVLRAGLRWRQG